MTTICIFGNDYSSPSALHASLKALLDLPEYYGGNADALNDCLGELPACPALWIRREGPEEVLRAMDLVSRVFADNGGDVKEL